MGGLSTDRPKACERRVATLPVAGLKKAPPLPPAPRPCPRAGAVVLGMRRRPALEAVPPAFFNPLEPSNHCAAEDDSAPPPP